MQNMFLKDYPFTKEEYNDIWKDCIFVVDANVLLNLYRYTEETRNELLDILTQLSERLWIPQQVGLEYHSNRVKVIIEQIEAFDQLTRLLDSSSRAVVKSLNEGAKDFKKRHPSIQLDSLTSDITKYIGTLIDKTKDEKQAHPNFLEKDTILDTITRLFNDKVGPCYDQETLDAIFAEGKERYEKKFPPGYEDLSTKEGSVKYYNNVVIKDEYGDLIVWKQILDKAKVDEVNIIFITDDSKEDWWNVIKGRTIGPRYELINEFTFQTQQQLIMYNTQRFMDFASTFLESTLSEKAREEMQKLTEANQHSSENQIARMDKLKRQLEELTGKLEKNSFSNEKVSDEKHYNFHQMEEDLAKILEEKSQEEELSSQVRGQRLKYFIPKSLINNIHNRLLTNCGKKFEIAKDKAEKIVRIEIYNYFDKKRETFISENLVIDIINELIDKTLIIDEDYQTYTVVPF